MRLNNFPDVVPILEKVGPQLQELFLEIDSCEAFGGSRPSGTHHNLNHLLQLAPNLEILGVKGQIVSTAEPVTLQKEWVSKLICLVLKNCVGQPSGTLLDILSNASRLEVNFTRFLGFYI